MIWNVQRYWVYVVLEAQFLSTTYQLSSIIPTRHIFVVYKTKILSLFFILGCCVLWITVKVDHWTQFHLRKQCSYYSKDNHERPQVVIFQAEQIYNIIWRLYIAEGCFWSQALNCDIIITIPLQASGDHIQTIKMTTNHNIRGMLQAEDIHFDKCLDLTIALKSSVHVYYQCSTGLLLYFQ